ncbi:hypothetical protein MNEG_12585 [Monoraphidium neglectum]|jgi:hypothetical protein|uniref:Uncharacterized protein n=1 Tax=Monoraphidium neglectum TaxID=145388 RepID=A0A0D2KHS6_9CHLO|nr:hypothetical protein MNEG_12585 [Monoraphidium neglectum]KIY95378.1 hypothetical protein MNEG_12585 [Monoraphidium neglectum]|eukprot:XP_013894398.1 hypothetical protein MNEG_12585 [Monoraphidium neglectum]
MVVSLVALLSLSHILGTGSDAVLRAAAACLPAEALAAIYAAAVRNSAGRRVCRAIDAEAPFDVPAGLRPDSNDPQRWTVVARNDAEVWQLTCCDKNFFVSFDPCRRLLNAISICDFNCWPDRHPTLEMMMAAADPDARPALAAACTIIRRVYPAVDPKAVRVYWEGEDQPAPLAASVRALLVGE